MKNVAVLPSVKASLTRKYSGRPNTPVKIVDIINVLATADSRFLKTSKNSCLNLTTTAAMVPRWRKMEVDNAASGDIFNQLIITSRVWPSLLMGSHSVTPCKIPRRTACRICINDGIEMSAYYLLGGVLRPHRKITGVELKA